MGSYLLGAVRFLWSYLQTATINSCMYDIVGTRRGVVKRTKIFELI